jgi:glycosyltransferase involved in cell wall biosynthesis
MGIPYSLRISGKYDIEDGPFSRSGLFEEGFLRECLKGARCVLALNDEIKNFLTDRFPFAKVLRVTNGVDIRIFHPRVGPKADNTDSVRYIFVGRLDPVKSIDFLLRAWKRFADRTPRVELEIVGDGPEKDRLIAETNRLGIDETVNFLGYREDIAEILRECDVMVLSSQKEGLPNVILEGMATALPMVVTNIPATRQLFQEGEAGYFIKFGDEEMYAERMSELFIDVHRRRNMGRRARQIVEERFSSSSVTRDLLRAYGLLEPTCVA